MQCGCIFRIWYTKASAKMPLAPLAAVMITEVSYLHKQLPTKYQADSGD